MSETETSKNWKWQIANRISTREQLEAYIELSDDERAAIIDQLRAASGLGNRVERVIEKVHPNLVQLTAVRAHATPRLTQHVPSMDLVKEGIETKLRLGPILLP